MEKSESPRFCPFVFYRSYKSSRAFKKVKIVYYQIIQNALCEKSIQNSDARKCFQNFNVETNSSRTSYCIK